LKTGFSALLSLLSKQKQPCGSNWQRQARVRRSLRFVNQTGRGKPSEWYRKNHLDGIGKTIWMVSEKPSEWFPGNIPDGIIETYQYVSINHSDGFRREDGRSKKEAFSFMATTHRAAFLAGTMQRTARHSCPLTLAQLSFRVTMRLKTGFSALLSLLSKQK
jgi:hypothetical protein